MLFYQSPFYIVLHVCVYIVRKYVHDSRKFTIKKKRIGLKSKLVFNHFLVRSSKNTIEFGQNVGHLVGVKLSFILKLDNFVVIEENLHSKYVQKWSNIGVLF